VEYGVLLRLKCQGFSIDILLFLPSKQTESRNEMGVQLDAALADRDGVDVRKKFNTCFVNIKEKFF